MSIGYLGYVKLGNTSGVAPANFLLATSAGLNRRIEPMISRAVTGRGWYNAASAIAYADNQQHFEGAIAFDLQYNTTIWSLFRDWLVENRVVGVSAQISPSGFISYLYQQVSTDPRSGVWLGSADIRIGAEALISVNANCLALKRAEVVAASTDYATNMRLGQTLPAGFLSTLNNPSPYNRNPIPGWNAAATVTWPNAPPFYNSTTQQFGMVAQDVTCRVNNNPVVIHGCTGEMMPVALLMGSIDAQGTIRLWRNGGIPDPYGDVATPSTFTASGANITLKLGGSATANISFNNIILAEDTYATAGLNEPVVREFGFTGTGDGNNPPCLIGAFA